MSKWKADNLFSSASNEWATPQCLFEMVSKEFGGFALDAAASAENHKVAYYYTQNQDALAQDWASSQGPVWLNPPYGRGIGQWIEKAYLTSQQGNTVVVLTFARTDTKWWHDWAMKADEIRFLRGRVHFVRPDHTSGPAPAPSVLLVYRGRERATNYTLESAPQVSGVSLPRGLQKSAA